MLPYYSKEVYVDASLMDGGDFSLVDPDGDYVIDEDCVRYCVYAQSNGRLFLTKVTEFR